jgi:son of sevenless-like protein
LYCFAIGVYFTDWVMSGEANSDMLRDKPDQINFAKRAKVADSIQQIQLHQATPYNLTPVPQLQTWMEDELEKASKLAQVPGSTDMMHKAYELSLVIEPREREDERSRFH